MTMPARGFVPDAARGHRAVTLALLLVVAGCETARAPFELARPSVAPVHTTTVVSVAASAESRVRIDALSEASRRILSTMDPPTERTQGPHSIEKAHAASQSAIDPGPPCVTRRTMMSRASTSARRSGCRLAVRSP